MINRYAYLEVALTMYDGGMVEFDTIYVTLISLKMNFTILYYVNGKYL